jgi:hypothetical protein
MDNELSRIEASVTGGGRCLGAIVGGPVRRHMRPVPYHRYKVGQIVEAPTGGPQAADTAGRI